MRLFLLALAVLTSYILWRIAAMRAKADVNMEGISWRMFVASLLIEPIFKLYGAELVITSGVDGTHKQDSKHYEGLALDYRTRDLSGREVEVAGKVAAALNPLGYDVVLEKDHLHVEYDPHT
jgi:hypothetical protein